MNPNDNGQAAGQPADAGLDNSDLGNQDNQNAGATGNPTDQNGGQSDTGKTELEQLRANNKALNRALIEARRGGGNKQPQNNQGQDGQNVFDTPEGQYAISLELATGQLIRKLEDVYSLYPEVPVAEIQRIRRNPWAFASHESYRAGDTATAMLEIEQALADRADEINAEKKGVNGSQPTKTNQQPAQINANPAGEAVVDAEPGSVEDQNPWTMPMDKLGKAARKEIAAKKAK